MTGRYVCEWERPDHPTRMMSEKDARAYFKAHDVRASCAFYLRDDRPEPLPDDLLLAVYDLHVRATTATRETPKHRAELKTLQRRVRIWLDGVMTAHETARGCWAGWRLEQMASRGPGTVNAPCATDDAQDAEAMAS